MKQIGFCGRKKDLMGEMERKIQAVLSSYFFFFLIVCHLGKDRMQGRERENRENNERERHRDLEN